MRAFLLGLALSLPLFASAQMFPLLPNNPFGRLAPASPASSYYRGWDPYFAPFSSIAPTSALNFFWATQYPRYYAQTYRGRDFFTQMWAPSFMWGGDPFFWFTFGSWAYRDAPSNYVASQRVKAEALRTTLDASLLRRTAQRLIVGRVSVVLDSTGRNTTDPEVARLTALLRLREPRYADSLTAALYQALQYAEFSAEYPDETPRPLPVFPPQSRRDNQFLQGDVLLLVDVLLPLARLSDDQLLFIADHPDQLPHFPEQIVSLRLVDPTSLHEYWRYDFTLRVSAFSTATPSRWQADRYTASAFVLPWLNQALRYLPFSPRYNGRAASYLSSKGFAPKPY